jgi:ATP-dependent Clp protease adaptor protein ClpS|tara:strand:+ start:298 stop:603 length:306 start_codon:yes stop_codon:yes gene_type:complete
MTADTKVKTDSKVNVSHWEPSMWKVLFHNDDVTPMQFVTQVLIEIFNKTEDQAVNLCKSIHEKGKGVVGVYPYDIAETKSSEATEVARSNNYPLKVTVEQE